jgi:two-component system LytT family response regulator
MALAHRDKRAPLERIFVRDRHSVIPVSVAEVSRIEAQDDYVMIHANGRRYLVSLRLGNLEEQLGNPPFLRVHRSHIVNLDHVERMTGLADGRFEVRMRDGSVVPVSRARSRDIRRLSH